MKKKLIAILSIIFVINVFSFNLNAAELDSRKSECLNAATQFVSRISQDLPLFFDWKSAEPINEKILYDETGKVKKAIIYSVFNNSIDKGYIIIDCKTYEILEFSKNASP